MTRLRFTELTRVLRFAVLAIATAAAGSLTAETEIGNGGDVITCPGEVHRVYDAFEAMELMRLEPNFGPSWLDPVAMAKFAIARLRRLDPVRAARFTDLVDRFMVEARMVPNANLRDIPDTDPSVVPFGCELKQAAIQYRDPAPRMPRYLIDRNIWLNLAPYQQTYLILHEVIYHETIRRGALDSRSARNFNAFLASAEFDTWTQEQYDAYLRDGLELPVLIERHGLILDGSTQVFDQAGQFVGAKTLAASIASEELDPTTLRMGARTILFGSGLFVRFDSTGEVVGGTGRVVAQRNGRVVGQFPAVEQSTARLRILGDTVHVDLGDYGNAIFGDPEACHVRTQPGEVSLSVDGIPLEVALRPDYRASARIGSDAECSVGLGWQVIFKDDLRFYPDGKPRRATIYEGAVLEDVAGQPITVFSGDIIDLSPTGRVEAVTRSVP